MSSFIIAAIFARGGSKGLPGKNIKELNGKPLIAYAIEIAKDIRGVSEVIVSTDDLEIAEVSRCYGAKVPFMRPEYLATDSSPEIEAWRHAVLTYEQLNNVRVDVLLSVPATSPLRIKEDVQGCLDVLLKSDADVAVVVTEAHRNPFFNMLRLDDQGRAKIVMSAEGNFFRRQDAPKVYDMTTVAYAIRRDYLLSTSSILQGNVRTYCIPVQRSLDIDTLFDFELAQWLMQKDKRS